MAHYIIHNNIRPGPMLYAFLLSRVVVVLSGVAHPVSMTSISAARVAYLGWILTMPSVTGYEDSTGGSKF